jgi:2-dehydro-3-deoxyphosphogluconate aldolase/(4S)-4-hydroxy-2-oxoglutarate aldolase
MKKIREYFALHNIICCGGIWMVNNDLIKAGNFSEIEKLTREALEMVR